MTNEGTKAGRAKCQLVAVDADGQQLRTRSTVTSQIAGGASAELIETIPGLDVGTGRRDDQLLVAARYGGPRITRTSMRPASSGASLTSAQAACERSTTRCSAVPQ